MKSIDEAKEDLKKAKEKVSKLETKLSKAEFEVKKCEAALIEAENLTCRRPLKEITMSLEDLKEFKNKMKKGNLLN